MADTHPEASSAAGRGWTYEEAFARNLGLVQVEEQEKLRTSRVAIVGMGGPLGKTKKVDAQGIADIANEMGAFTVVRAASHEAAAKMFEDHPHFSVFPGERVEVMPVLPIPGG